MAQPPNYIDIPTINLKISYYSRRNAEHKRQQIMNAIPF